MSAWPFGDTFCRAQLSLPFWFPLQTWEIMPEAIWLPIQTMAQKPMGCDVL